MAKVVIHLNYFMYNNGMKLRNYLKIDGKWYRSICSLCLTPTQGVESKLCSSCWRESLQGKVRVVHNAPHSKATKDKISMVKTVNWDKCGYGSRHRKIRNKYGKAYKCESDYCKGISNTFDWANIDHKYTEDISSWKQLCRSCHSLYDKGSIDV